MPLGSQVGGSEALLGHLLRHPDHRYRYVCAFLQEGPFTDEVRDLGYDTTVFHAQRLSDFSNYFKTTWALRSWMKEKQLHAVVSWMPKAQLYAGVAALFLSTRVFWFQHTIVMGDATLMRIATLIPTQAIFCCSDTVKKSQDLLFPGRQSFVCYPGVLMPAAHSVTQSEARSQLGLPLNAPVIGMVARLERWKGAHIFVRAASSILRDHPDATLFVVGGAHRLDPAYAVEIESMVRDLNCEGRFILAGQRPMTEAILWQTAADLIVHPVTGVEPFGMAIVEAMAQGKVVVTNNRGGPSEIIDNGTNGVLIENDNPALLAATVLHLIKNPEQRQAMEKEAYLRGRSFSIDAFVSRFEAIIGTVLNPTESVGPPQESLRTSTVD